MTKKIDKRDEMDAQVDIYSMTRPKLEHHCMYLMQKRRVLEDLILDLQRQIRERDERIEFQNKTIGQLREKMKKQQEVYIDAIQGVNTERQHISEEMAKLESRINSDNTTKSES